MFPHSLITLMILAIISALIIKEDLKINLRQVGSGRTIVDLIKVSQFLAAQIKPGEKFNLVAVYADQSRFDHNAVDYRYFLETNQKIRTPGWDVLDYQQAETVYLIAETGEIDPLKINFWELELFGPERVVSSWKLSKKVVIYKLGKN